MAKAIIKKESYLIGYLYPIMSARLFHLLWLKLDNETRKNPSEAPYILMNKHNKGKIKYIQMLNSKFPTFLHQIYCTATKRLGLTATTKSLCHYIKKIAKELYPTCPIWSILRMNKYFFWCFFYMHGGKLVQPITKPRLTPEHIANRLAFSRKWLDKLDSEENLYYAFLDKKWFYTTSRKKK